MESLATTVSPLNVALTRWGDPRLYSMCPPGVPVSGLNAPLLWGPNVPGPTVNDTPCLLSLAGYVPWAG